jgi:hypothetical protein
MSESRYNHETCCKNEYCLFFQALCNCNQFSRDFEWRGQLIFQSRQLLVKLSTGTFNITVVFHEILISHCTFQYIYIYIYICPYYMKTFVSDVFKFHFVEFIPVRKVLKLHYSRYILGDDVCISTLYQ